MRELCGNRGEGKIDLAKKPSSLKRVGQYPEKALMRQNSKILALTMLFGSLAMVACVEEAEKGPEPLTLVITECPEEYSTRMCDRETGEFLHVYCGSNPEVNLCTDAGVAFCDDFNVFAKPGVCQNWCYMGGGAWTQAVDSSEEKDPCIHTAGAVFCWDGGEIEDCL